MPRKKKEVIKEVVETTEVVEEQVTTAKEAKVFNKNQRLMRTFTGKDAVKEAEAMASQERRDGWTVVVR